MGDALLQHRTMDLVLCIILPRPLARDEAVKGIEVRKSHCAA